MIVAPDGRLFGTILISETKATHLFAYDPADDAFRDLGELVSDSEITVMAFGEDGRLYAGITPQDESKQAYLLAYDLESTRVQSVTFPFTGKRRIPALAMASDGSVYGAAGDHLFCYDVAEKNVADLGMPLGAVDILGLALSEEGRLYGVGDCRAPYLFEYDLSSRLVVTLTDEIMVWRPENFDDLDIGVILNGGMMCTEAAEYSILLCYDPASTNLAYIESPTVDFWDVDELSSGPQSMIYAIIPHYDRVCVYRSPPTGEFDDLPEQLCAPGHTDCGLRHYYVDHELAVSAEGVVYLGWEECLTYTPAENPLQEFWADLGREVEKWMPGRGSTPTPAYVRRTVEWQEVRLLAYKPEAYAQQGVIESELIEPHALAVTRTQVTDDWTTIAGLAWGSDGALYGYGDRLFRYRPDVPGHIEWIDTPSLDSSWEHGATTLVSTPDGLVVGAVGPHLVSYDPVEGTVVTATLPISPTSGAAALAAGRDGYVYGSTRKIREGASSHWGRGPSHLFVYSPTVGTVIDLGTPLTATGGIDDLVVVAPDGRVYGTTAGYVDGEPIPSPLFACDPTTRSITLSHPCIPAGNSVVALVAASDGKIYVGTSSRQGWPVPDGRLFVYDPAADVLTELPLPATKYGGRKNVVSLTMSDDGLLYGSMGGGHVFVYDPRHPRVPPRPVARAMGVDLILQSGPDGVMYGAVGSYDSYYGPGASLIAFSTRCTSGAVSVWERVTWEAETPPGTRIVVDVLDEEGDVLLRNVKNGGLLWRIDPVRNPAIRLRATLSTRDERVTPVLKSWWLDYTYECQK